jgi:signal transduction histidine kinase
MADISDVLSRTLDLNAVINTLKEQIGQALRIKKMEVVILGEGDGITSSPAASRNDKKETAPRNDSLKKLIAYFKNQREVLVLEEIKRKHAEKVKFDKSFLLIKELEKLKAALVVPLLVKQKLVGLFLLRAKRSGDMFTNEDIKTLEVIAAQAAIAIENARLYEEMKDFSKTLQKEVARQTKKLREANIRLRQLDKAKSEFISLASHQLRTPLSIIKGYISMILEGTWGKTNEKQKEQLKKVYLSNERLIKLVEDLLTVSRIESGRLEFDWELVSLEDMIESVISEFSQVAAKKGLYLKYIKPNKPLPKVKVDSLKIRQVIQNLVDNALHYTKKGGVTIRLKKKKDKIVFSIQDTGIGISPKEQVTLFEKFSRGKYVGKMHTEGTGLGLYLAAKMIEAHQGKIWVESAGKDKGSTFYFELGVRGKGKH